jgi:hypothetical protein
MASSRWKRFAFFEKNSLNIDADILEDLIPTTTASAKNIRPLSIASSTSLDSVSLCVTTASLPASVFMNEIEGLAEERRDNNHRNPSIAGFWSSLLACAPDSLQQDDARSSLVLPNQGQSVKTLSSAKPSSSSNAMDGLVLIFLTSRDTEFVHCVDITVRSHGMGNEEKDGWRGYFSPFTDSKVMNIASCRDSQGGTFLACLGTSTATSHTLVVYQDPHLHLTCRKPLQVSALENATAFSIVKSQQQQWNLNIDGEAYLVDIVPGMVAVGTRNGAVLIYAFSEGKNVLRPHLRIPPPPISDIQVVSVKVAMLPTKAHVFVAYNRESTSTSMSTAGLCCYDIPLPSSATTITAPLARHDLDGRFVGSSSLVDCLYGENASRVPKVTVVRCFDF